MVMLTTDSGFYLGTANKVWFVDTSAGAWGATNVLSIQTSEEIIAMTDIGDQIIIYANIGSSGKQYYWSKIDNSTSRTINWYDRPFINVANINNVDYAFVGTASKRQIYIASGYTPQLVKTSIPREYTSGGTPDIKRLFFNPNKTNNIETMTQRIFVPDDVGNIYSVGNSIP